MAATRDAASNSGAKAGVATYNWNHTVGYGNNRLLVVSIACRGATDANRPVTGITLNSVALSFIRADDNVSGDVTSELWYLLDPAVGTWSVAVTHTGTLSVGGVGMATSFFGVAQQAPEANGGFNDNTAAAATASLTTLTANALVVDATYNKDDGGHTPDGAQTTDTDLDAVFANDDCAGQSHKVVAAIGATTMVWTHPGADSWAISAAAFAAAADLGPTPLVMAPPIPT